MAHGSTSVSKVYNCTRIKSTSISLPCHIRFSCPRRSRAVQSYILFRPAVLISPPAQNNCKTVGALSARSQSPESAMHLSQPFLTPCFRPGAGADFVLLLMPMLALFSRNYGSRVGRKTVTSLCQGVTTAAARTRL